MPLEIVRVPYATEQEDLVALLKPGDFPAVIPFYTVFRRRLLIAFCDLDNKGARAYERNAYWNENLPLHVHKHNLHQAEPDYTLFSGDVVQIPYRNQRLSRPAGDIVLRHLMPNHMDNHY